MKILTFLFLLFIHFGFAQNHFSGILIDSHKEFIALKKKNFGFGIEPKRIRKTQSKLRVVRLLKTNLQHALL